MKFRERWKSVEKEDVYFYRVHSFYKTNNSPVAFISVLATYSNYHKRVCYNIAYYEDKQQWENAASETFKSDMAEKDALEFMQELNAVI
jgi:hypothetical protein